MCIYTAGVNSGGCNVRINGHGPFLRWAAVATSLLLRQRIVFISKILWQYDMWPHLWPLGATYPRENSLNSWPLRIRCERHRVSTEPEHTRKQITRRGMIVKFWLKLSDSIMQSWERLHDVLRDGLGLFRRHSAVYKATAHTEIRTHTQKMAKSKRT